MLNHLADFFESKTAKNSSKILFSLISIGALLCVDGQAHAAPETHRAGLLLPLEAGRPSPHQISAELSATAESINTAFAKSQAPKTEPEVLLPVVGELLNEEGKFDWGMDIPITFDFGDLIGNPVLIVGTDFQTD